MTSQLFKGSTLIGLANRDEEVMVTKTITARMAVESIIDKFGEIEREADYYHRAKNEWSKYNTHLDSLHKSQVVGDKYQMSRKHLGDRSHEKGKGGYL